MGGRNTIAIPALGEQKEGKSAYFLFKLAAFPLCPKWISSRPVP
jgi:hypothetical protein